MDRWNEIIYEGRKNFLPEISGGGEESLIERVESVSWIEKRLDSKYAGVCEWIYSSIPWKLLLDAFFRSEMSSRCQICVIRLKKKK